MSRLPRIRGGEVLRALQKKDFVLIRVKGSHHFLRHADGRTTVVPVHAGDIIGPGLLRSILRDCELTVDEFESLL